MFNPQNKVQAQRKAPIAKLAVPGPSLRPAPAVASSVVMAFSRFAQSIPLGDSDHIMLGPLKTLHGTEKHTRADWHSMMQQLKNRPVKRSR